MAPLLEARAISRRFGHVRALDRADFAVQAGEICALVGDNGAGKSTLVKILSGADRPDEGQILLAGKPVAFNSPNDAQAHGIATVYQDLALAADLSPFENLFLGREIVLPGLLGQLGFVNRAAMRRQAGEQFERLGVRLRSARASVSSLSGGQRQSVAIARAAMWADRVIFMDEPTAALGVVQTGRVLDLIKQVRDQGIAVVLISHNMPQVLAVADRIEVLRLGRRVAQFAAQGRQCGPAGGGDDQRTDRGARDMSAASLGEQEDERLSPLERWAGLLGGGWIFVLLIALIAIFTALRPEQFGSSFNLSMLAINAAILLVLSVGQTFVIIAGGIDLSVGTVLVFASIASAEVMLRMSGAAGGAYGATQGGWGVVFVGLIVALVSGAFWGAVNGALVAAARIPPLIVTLGTFGMALGFAQILTNGTDIRAVPATLVDGIGSGAIAGVPVLVVIAAAVALVGAVVLHLTRFGVHVFAIGSDKEAARRAGINVGRKLVAIYVLSGALAGLAAMMSTARFATTTIGGHAMDNLSTISAVVLGGTSLFGGIGSIAGTVVGVFIPIVLLNGFVILGIPPFWQTVATGAVLILAVWIDQLKRRARERS